MPAKEATERLFRDSPKNDLRKRIMLQERLGTEANVKFAETPVDGPHCALDLRGELLCVCRTGILGGSEVSDHEREASRCKKRSEFRASFRLSRATLGFDHAPCSATSSTHHRKGYRFFDKDRAGIPEEVKEQS